MLSQNQRLLRAVEAKQKETAKVAEEILDLCAEEKRDRTEDEDAIVSECHETLLKLDTDADELKRQIEIDKDVMKFAGDNGDMADVQVINEPAPAAKSWGEQFTDSKSYDELIEKMQTGSLGDNWRSGGVELKGTLSVMPGTAFYQPQVQPGVVETLYQPPTVADVMAQGQTSSPIVRYVTESTTVANAAAGVAAGGAKPESTLDFTQVDEPVKKIATYLPVQDEIAFQQSRNLAICWDLRVSDATSRKAVTMRAVRTISRKDLFRQESSEANTPDAPTGRNNTTRAKIESDLYGDMQNRSGDALVLS